MKELVIINSNIKGYYVFKIRPHQSVKMLVEKEHNNEYDPHAMVVKMPELKEIHSSIHEDVTKEAKGKEPQQTVKDIAGKTVGRVPANLCKLFEKLLKDGYVTNITCSSQNDPERSKIPPPEQSFKRKKNDHDRRGGGAVIPCHFTLICHDSTYKKVAHYLKEKLAELTFQGSEKLKDIEKSWSCTW